MAEFLAITIAEWIERGLELVTSRADGGLRVRESQRAFLELAGTTYRAGSLGLALIGKDGDPQVALQRWIQVSGNSLADQLEAAARLLGIPVALARLVELNHRGGITARVIAKNLRAGTLGMAMVADHPAIARPAAAALADLQASVQFRPLEPVANDPIQRDRHVSHA
ncbi:MAG TPA: hypothetical protein VME43_27375 [Bryobacteraceae bacterium]|nr:hypothetical protein [Bryobacteraceae bacterium]